MHSHDKLVKGKLSCTFEKKCCETKLKKMIDIELICLRAGSSSTNRKGSSTIYGLTLEYCRRYSSAKEFKEEK